MNTEPVTTVNDRENESIHETALVTGVTACPGIERVSAAMQTEPGLFNARAGVNFSETGGAEISMHDCPFADVHAMMLLLSVNLTPVKLCQLSDGDRDQSRLAVTFNDGDDCYGGGCEIVWYADADAALLVLGPNMSALLTPAKGRNRLTF